MIRSQTLSLWRGTMALDTVRIVPDAGPCTLFPPGKAPVDWCPVFDMRPGRVVILYDVGGPMWRSCYMEPAIAGASTAYRSARIRR